MHPTNKQLVSLFNSWFLTKSKPKRGKLTFKCSCASLTVFPSFFFFQLWPSFRKFLSIFRSNNTIVPPIISQQIHIWSASVSEYLFLGHLIHQQNNHIIFGYSIIFLLKRTWRQVDWLDLYIKVLVVAEYSMNLIWPKPSSLGLLQYVANI